MHSFILDTYAFLSYICYFTRISEVRIFPARFFNDSRTRHFTQSQMNTAKISIIVRTKDRPEQLRHTLSSIDSDILTGAEVIVVNDGGSDVGDVVKGVLGSRVPFSYIPLKTNEGRSQAGNIGVEASGAPLLFFLDDDDLLIPAGLQSFIELYEGLSSPADVVLYGKVEAIRYQSGDSEGETYRFFGREFDPTALLWENYIPFNAAVIPRDIFVQAGGLDPEMTVFEDWDLFLKLSQNVSMTYHPILIACYRIYQDSFILADKWAALQEECRIKILRKHWEKITPESLARIYGVFKRDLRHELVPEISHLVAEIEKEREKRKEQDEERKEQDEAQARYEKELVSHIASKDNYISELAEEISRKDTYIKELTEEITRKGTYIDELSEEISRKEKYIDELALEIERKGAYIKQIESERIKWRSMDIDRAKYVSGLAQHIRNLEKLLSRFRMNS